MGSRKPLGVPIQDAREGQLVLGRAGSCASECMAGARIQRKAADAGGSGRCSLNSRRHQCDQAGHGIHGGDTIFDTKDKERQEKRGVQTETNRCRRSDRRQEDQRRREGQRQGEREATGMLRLEQQQWGLCWLTTRCRLPRKGGKGARMHQVRLGGTPFMSMPSEGRLIAQLQMDWFCRTPTTRRRSDMGDDANKTSWYPPLWMWAGSNADRRGRERRDSRSGDKDKAGEERSRSRRRRRQHNEDKAEFNGKLMTLDIYLMKRRFFFLHLYSGPHDPLGTTLERLAKRCKMKVTVESYDRENGGADLLADQPYAKLLQQAREGKWDGYHAGFPCTSSRLRWREREGYPGPCRSRSHPYGIPGNSVALQKECDQGPYMPPGH